MNNKQNHFQKTMTDPATGLANEALYMIYMEEINHRGLLREYSSFFFSITGLDEVKKQYGAKESSKVLNQYVGNLKRFVNDDEFLGSLGGGIFVALVKKNRTREFLEFITYVKIETVNHGELIKHEVGAISGIWRISEEVRDTRDLIGTPSIAYIEAKYIFQQEYVTVSEGAVSRVTQQRDAVDTFREAIKNNEFVVYYQPKVDSNTNTIIGAEGLVRWMHNGEIVSPGVFIRPMEQTGEILQLDYFVLKTICEDIKSWTEKGITPVPVSVNCSRKNLLDEDLADNLNYIISKAGIDKNLIEVEVKEPLNGEEYGFMAEFVGQLFDMGITTAIDDFGAGFSSLTTMRDFKVHTLKIPRSFISTDDFSKQDEIILTHIVQMAKEMDIQIMMQGVEREDQLAFVRSAGCSLIQGYYYDRPLSKEEFEKRLVNKKYEK